MTITSLDELVNAMANNSSRLVIDKASLSNVAVAQFHSLWRATGQPGQGAIPTTVAVPTNATTGTFNFTQQTSPATTYIAYLEAVSSNNAVSVEIHDRLAHSGGLVGNVATAQTTNLPLDMSSLLATDNIAERIGDADYGDIQWWLEWYTDTGSTATTITVNVTYNDATTGNLTAGSIAATRRASYMLPLNGLIPAAASGKRIRGVNSVTFTATTGTAGALGVTATRPRASLYCPLANARWSADWAALPLSDIPNSSALFMIMMPGTTTTGTLRGNGKLPHG